MKVRRTDDLTVMTGETIQIPVDYPTRVSVIRDRLRLDYRDLTDREQDAVIQTITKSLSQLYKRKGYIFTITKYK